MSHELISSLSEFLVACGCGRVVIGVEHIEIVIVVVV